MFTSTNLMEKYKQILAEPITEESAERVTLLSHTDWVRIMIVRSPENIDVCGVEVEVSSPTCIIDPTSKDFIDEKIPASSFIRNTISHLEYLLKLENAGFLLGIFSAEGFWSASIELTDCPDLDFFDILIPPK